MAHQLMTFVRRKPDIGQVLLHIVITVVAYVWFVAPLYQFWVDGDKSEFIAQQIASLSDDTQSQAFRRLRGESGSIHLTPSLLFSVGLSADFERELYLSKTSSEDHLGNIFVFGTVIGPATERMGFIGGRTQTGGRFEDYIPAAKSIAALWRNEDNTVAIGEVDGAAAFFYKRPDQEWRHLPMVNSQNRYFVMPAYGVQLIRPNALFILGDTADYIATQVDHSWRLTNLARPTADASVATAVDNVVAWAQESDSTLAVWLLGDSTWTQQATAPDIHGVIPYSDSFDPSAGLYLIGDAISTGHVPVILEIDGGRQPTVTRVPYLAFPIDADTAWAVESAYRGEDGLLYAEYYQVYRNLAYDAELSGDAWGNLKWLRTPQTRWFSYHDFEWRGEVSSIPYGWAPLRRSFHMERDKVYDALGNVVWEPAEYPYMLGDLVADSSFVNSSLELRLIPTLSIALLLYFAYVFVGPVRWRFRAPMAAATDAKDEPKNASRPAGMDDISADSSQALALFFTDRLHSLRAHVDKLLLWRLRRYCVDADSDLPLSRQQLPLGLRSRWISL